MSANLENSAVAMGLEKVNFSFQSVHGVAKSQTQLSDFTFFHFSYL